MATWARVRFASPNLVDYVLLDFAALMTRAGGSKAQHIALTHQPQQIYNCVPLRWGAHKSANYMLILSLFKSSDILLRIAIEQFLFRLLCIYTHSARTKS